MAIRQTRFQLKNNQNSAAPFSGTSLLVGEPIVNTAAGIMMFSGVTSGTDDWTPAGPGGNATFFEVGSNLYDLRLRNRITQYEGISGIGLVGKILSGTTSGLTLVDATNINGISAFTYTASANTFTIIDSNGTEYPATFTTVSGLTVNGDFTVTGNTFLNFLTANTISATTITVDDININDDATVSGDLTVNNLNVTGTTTISGGITADTISATTITTDDIYVNDDAFVSGDLTVHNLTVTGSTVLNTVTANTISATTITSDDINVNNDVNIGGDLSVTGNTVLQSVSATSFSATSINLPTLGANRVVYTTGSGLLTTESNFTYDEGTDTLGVNNIEASGDVTIQGSLTVFGASVSAFTTNLYVEDPNVFLNYNPTGSTTLTSVNAGFTIQDGSGVSGQNVNFDIVIMQDLTGLTSNQTPIITEYTGPTGYSNRGWITQLNDIIIRSTDPIDSPTGSGAINGVRVLAEFDVLDGGTY